MATADQVKALIRSHADGDDTRFYAIAMQVAAQAARSGHGKFATELRDLVDQVKGRSKALEPARGARAAVPLAQPRGELAGLLTAGYPKTRVSDMALTDALRTRLDRVLGEQRERARLREHGFSPMRKLLLVGPPGTGKTMTAAALAGELSLPLFSIQLDGLITKYMGETAAKLRLVFDAIQSTRGVYLFDEFDALGGERGTKNDVGEIRRVLNSFLQFIEQDDSDSLILGATNHVGLLDRSLFRRFDAVLECAPPYGGARDVGHAGSPRAAQHHGEDADEEAANEERRGRSRWRLRGSTRRSCGGTSSRRFSVVVDMMGLDEGRARLERCLGTEDGDEAGPRRRGRVLVKCRDGSDR